MALYHAKNLGKDRVHFYQSVIQNLHKNISSDHQQLIGAFKGLLSTISAKDKYTLGHSERVATYAVMIGEAMHLSMNDITTLQYAGLLHDIGKIELPKNILNKLGPLKTDEFDFIKLHPVYSANILEPLEDMNHLIKLVRHHHERFDGTGYPDQLAGEEIILGARILCVADAFDAMLSERPYSKSMSVNDAIAELEHCSGTQFDPKIVKAFIEVIKGKLLITQEESVEDLVNSNLLSSQ
jgi:putative nucleotidyltransferase with HDIG domain